MGPSASHTTGISRLPTTRISETAAWHDWRNNNLKPVQYPVGGFDHVYGQSVIDEIDNHPLGSSRIWKCVTTDYGSEKTPADC